MEKWSSGLDDPLTRVPFVIRTPGGKPGHVVEEPVEVFDQMATVLDLANVEPRHTHFARSLVPQLRGEPGDPDRAAFAEGRKGMHEPHVFEANPTDPHWHETHDKANIYYPKLALQHDEPMSDTRSMPPESRYWPRVRIGE